MTSHDAVMAVRRITGQRRVGHAGTLDPMAEGVLVLGLGEGTRVLDRVSAGTKVYCARRHLGIRTTTDDAGGEVIARGMVTSLRKATILQALQHFVGPQEQIPPQFSAIKQQGIPAYRRARQGQVVALPPRQVAIHRIRLLRWKRPHLIVEVTCSKGTYLRALARDLGEYLGCGAHLCGLVRIQVGPFTLEEAAPLPLVEHAVHQGYLHQLLYAIDEAFIDLPAVILDSDHARRVSQGAPLTLGMPVEGDMCRAYDEGGNFLALLVRRETTWHPDKVFGHSPM